MLGNSSQVVVRAITAVGRGLTVWSVTGMADTDALYETAYEPRLDVS
jgi:hypothetical protein